MGIDDFAFDVRTKVECRRRLGGIQEENVVGNEGQVEEDEITDDGREERRESGPLMAETFPFGSPNQGWGVVGKTSVPRYNLK